MTEELPQMGKTYVAEIVDLNNLGFGVCKIGGMSVFVADTVEGDLAEITIIKKAKTYAVGKRNRLVSPSAFRIPDQEGCPRARQCGGCAFQRITYGEELRLKQKQVRFALRKAGLNDVTVHDVLSTGQISRYRNKAQFPVGKGPTGATEVGFYRPRSHTLVPINDCLLLPESFSRIAKWIASYCDREQISPYDEKERSGLLRHIFLREGKATGDVMVCLVINGKAFPKEQFFCAELVHSFPSVVSVVLSINREQTNVILGGETRVIWGNQHIEDVLCGLRFEIGPNSFYQVNHDATEILYSKAAELLALQPGERVLDLYCGIGTIGLSMIGCDDSRRVCSLIGMEEIPEAVKSAESNARNNGISNASFIVSDLQEDVKERNWESLDAVIVDPPRKGLSDRVIRMINRMMIPRVLYISCDPDTLARDLVIFRDAGYVFKEVFPVDLFPRTGHVEVVTLITRAGVEATE